MGGYWRGVVELQVLPTLFTFHTSQGDSDVHDRHGEPAEPAGQARRGEGQTGCQNTGCSYWGGRLRQRSGECRGGGGGRGAW